jgi:hypothetical protein
MATASSSSTKERQPPSLRDDDDDDLKYEIEEEEKDEDGEWKDMDLTRSGMMVTSSEDHSNEKIEDVGGSEKDDQHVSNRRLSTRSFSRNQRHPQRRIVVTTTNQSTSTYSSSTQPADKGETIEVSSIKKGRKHVTTATYSNNFDGMKVLGEQLDLLQRESISVMQSERRPTSLIGYGDVGRDLVPEDLRLNSRNELMDFDDHHISILTEEVIQIYSQCLPHKDEEIRRQRFMHHLSKIIRSKWPDALLELYGSAANQLGHQGADIDICLMFTKEIIDPRGKILQELGRRLRSARMTEVMVLKHARVPIVKFTDPVSGYSCDICYENRLAIHNTRLLKTYSMIDPRVRPLIFLVKYWARQRKINESSLGTLSR